VVAGEIGCVIFRKGHSLTVFQNRVLKKVLRYKMTWQQEHREKYMMSNLVIVNTHQILSL